MITSKLLMYSRLENMTMLFLLLSLESLHRIQPCTPPLPPPPLHTCGSRPPFDLIKAVPAMVAIFELRAFPAVAVSLSHSLSLSLSLPPPRTNPPLFLSTHRRNCTLRLMPRYKSRHAFLSDFKTIATNAALGHGEGSPIVRGLRRAFLGI